MMRIGFGYDLHRLVEGRPLVLGGVRIAHEKGLLGHSDGDVLLHAVIDALLGAANLGDIGRMFPDTDPDYKGISSLNLLTRAGEKVRGLASIVNIDATVVCEKPRLSPHAQTMRGRLALSLEIPEDRISVKATTTEGLGPEGTGEAISAYAVALLDLREGS
jgi:2-C-methyl-D-erythritol 2,4-cyclodiphosphate synthase